MNTVENFQETQKREGTNAIVVAHCAVLGRSVTLVRKWRVGEVRSYAQYPVSVAISFCGPRERKLRSVIVTPDNLRFYTIERVPLVGDRGERVLYDSRADVPCDMEEWRECREKRKAAWLARKAEHEAFRQHNPLPPGIRIDSGFDRNPWEIE